MENQDHYAFLGVPKKASPTAIKESYLRLKRTFSEENQAWYSLSMDLSQSLARLEKAYQVLREPQSRIAYDGELLKNSQVTAEELWLPSRSALIRWEGEEEEKKEEKGERQREEEPPHCLTFQEESQTRGVLHRTKPHRPPEVLPILEKVLTQEAWGDGNLYKKIRHILNISPKELENHTKISWHHIDSVEHNRFDQLPQPIYIRGFLSSYLAFLGLDHIEEHVKAYMSRYEEWQNKKSSSYPRTF